jgi:hypothetical protein
MKHALMGTAVAAWKSDLPAYAQELFMTRKKQDAIDLLIGEQLRFGVLFKVFDALQDKPEDAYACAAIIDSTCMELRAHSMLEVEMFYPALRVPADEDLWSHLDEAEVRQQTIGALIDKIDLLPCASPLHIASFGVLAEYVKRHFHAEKEIFARIRRLKKLNLDMLGALMQARKEELLEQIEEIETDMHEEDFSFLPATALSGQAALG